MWARRNLCAGCGWLLVLLVVAADSRGQAPLPLYTDHLVNGFQDWSWAQRNLENSAPVHSGSNSISVSATAWQALSFEHPDFDATLYASLVFWAHGGAHGGQVLQVTVQHGSSNGPGYELPALAANTWKECVIPLGTLGAGGATNLNRLNIALASSGAAGTFYIDDVQLTAKPAPALAHLSVDAGSPIRAAEARWFGVNTAIWDSDLDTAQTVSLLEEMGALVLRFPGGSASDEYHWAANRSGTNTWSWATSFSGFARVATNAGAQAFITVNYGTGTAEEAANWVRCANVTNRYGFKYWEIGNEVYGTWETDANVHPNDAYNYATRAKDYLAQMKAADPTINGWRTMGDLGMLGGLTERYPAFYAAKLMHDFARPGDAILAAGSDYKLLAVYDREKSALRSPAYWNRGSIALGSSAHNSSKSARQVRSDRRRERGAE